MFRDPGAPLQGRSPPSQPSTGAHHGHGENRGAGGQWKLAHHQWHGEEAGPWGQVNEGRTGQGARGKHGKWGEFWGTGATGADRWPGWPYGGQRETAGVGSRTGTGRVTTRLLMIAGCCERILPTAARNSRTLGCPSPGSSRWSPGLGWASPSARSTEGGSPRRGWPWPPKSLQNARHTWDVNCGPRPDTMSWGSPKTRKTWVKISEAVSKADGSLGRGINRQALENLSMTTQMTVLPWGLWEASDEVCRHVGPRTPWDGQRAE